MTKESEEILQALQSAVAEELDKKRRLEHYAVVWQNNRTVIIENNDKRLRRTIPTDQ